MHLTILSVLMAAFWLSLPANLQPVTPLKFDEFGRIPCVEEKVRVDNYGRALQEHSQGLAVVIVYAGRSDTSSGEVVARLFGIRDRLRSRSSIEQNRIMILDGGVREKLQVQLWIVPADSREAATMLLDSQVSPRNIRLKSPRMEQWKYECSGAR